MRKIVSFNLDKNKVYDTYSITEYNRIPIDSILYLRCYNRISDYEWFQVFETLNYFKTREMIVHKESVENIKLSKKIIKI
jgi:hypothetical protein